MSESISWSDWLDYNAETISKAPINSGVFMMHAAMKILFIQGTKNIRKDLESTLSNACISQATRFSDYKNRHEGNMPKCMQE